MDSAIEAANERQSHVTQDEEARRIYWSRRKAELDRVSGLDWARREGVKAGEESGRKEGRKEGRDEGLIIAARNALAKGLSIEDVRDITGLDLETINAVISSNEPE